MAKKLAKKTHARRPKTKRHLRRNSKPSFLYRWALLIGLLILIGVVLLFLHSSQGKKHHPKPAASKATKQAPKQGTHKTLTTQLRFEFYRLLPKMQVWIPKQTLPINTKKASLKPHVYSLQIASFKDYSKADHLKAQLTLQGYQVKISKHQNQKSVWYQVRLGPFQNKAAAFRVQKKLHRRFHHMLIIAVKKANSSNKQENN
jgi:cell division protein FtsN